MADRGAPARSLVGSTFAGKYRVVQHLRSGGIAHVYLAELLAPRPGAGARGFASQGPDLARTGRPARVALKVLRDELQRDPSVIRRFERGAIAASRIEHPNVARIGALERLPSGAPFCTLELLIGLDLADTLAGTGRLDPGRARRIAEGAAAGLAAAHAAGVVHLDVKPENLFLVHQPDGRELVKLLDFGLSSVSEEGGAARGDRPSLPPVEAACSTPEYMAPEQRRGVPPSPAMDVYALGVVLHEMLAGHTPHEASGVRTAPPRDSSPSRGSSPPRDSSPSRDSTPGPRGDRRSSAPDVYASPPDVYASPPDVYASPPEVYAMDSLGHVPPGLLGVLARALARDPSERFASMEELRAALAACAEDTPATPSGGWGRASGSR